ncbi:hypothetical protein B0H17DRAFT_1160505 [Mycena rosella]|uniref:Uncharacterized protein n=1 Tax=Mycena rosella TaxID=1033263 RepID=A0AAD7DAQ1_MYCRO|nr:hypothetical protein B0H17DRAFT_1160505 [Mycena rosella]
MRVFLWVLKEAGCRETIPSFDYLRRVQKEVHAQCGIPTVPCKSVQGNVDWANPTTHKLIHVYPEIPEDGIIREVWHAQKWRKNMDLDILSPMYDAGGTHYFVNEIACLHDGNFAVPIRWVKFRSKVYADAFCVSLDDENYYDLEHAGEIPNWAAVSIQAGHPDRMPNPKRAIAAGRPLYSSFVNYFGDNVSGNRTKSWNKHWNAYMTHANLPRQLLQQDVSEQFCEFKTALEVTHTEPVEVKDESGEATRFCLYVNSGPSDNPMQSEISGHIGGKGNCLCRKCRVGGTQAERATNEGYHAIFEAGEPRTKEYILEELEKQVKLACSGVSKHVKDKQTETGVKDIYTQYWIDELIARFKEMKKDEPNRPADAIQAELVQWDRFDPARDTPVEILHTILLGLIKYVWIRTHTPWSAENIKTYSTRLQSTNTEGLSIHAIRSNYIMQYASSLIGRQFKTLAQTNIFHVHGLVSDNEFQGWKAAGELSALMWFPEIGISPNTGVAVANVLDIFATIDPSKIVAKVKYHLLIHTDEDVVQFGPLIGLATELFESFNAVFRYCSILSNHLAPSRDIAIQLADQEGLKHRLTGGWWSSGSDANWQRAGPGVRNFMADHPILQRLVGWTEKKSSKHAHASNYRLYSPASVWKKCIHVISESLDECFVGSWVFAKSAVATVSGSISGRISDILADSTGMVLVVLELFQIFSSRDEVYGMPVLVRRHSEVEFSIVPGKNIKFKFNVQHDCCSAECEATGVRMRMQERVQSDQTENYIIHNNLDRFLINTHAFHNAHLLRATLPRDLVAPIPLFTERRAKHDELAAQLPAAAAKKRKQSQGDSNSDGDTEERPRKKKKKAAPKQPASKMISAAHSMVANRSRRAITRTEKAKAAEVGPESEDELSSDYQEESDDFLDNSEDDFSD